MPNLRGIISQINSALQAGVFSTAKFQDAKINNLAYLVGAEVPDGENQVRIVRPVIIDNDGECTDLSADDTVALQLYHRNTGLAYDDKQEDDFGGPGNNVTEIADMIMIVIGDRSRLKLVQEDLSAAIWTNVPRTLPHATLTNLNLQSADIMPMDLNVNSEAVWAQEFPGVEYALSPEDFMISIKYKITTLFSSKCFNICN